MALPTPPPRRSSRSSMRSKQIGQLLVENEDIKSEHLAKALKTQEKEGGLLGQVLQNMGACGPDAVAAALLKQVQVTDVPCRELLAAPRVVQLVPKDLCESEKLCPFELVADLLCVAMGNPLNRRAINAVEETTRYKVKPFKDTWPNIRDLIERSYTEEALNAVIEEVSGAGPELENVDVLDAAVGSAAEADELTKEPPAQERAAPPSRPLKINVDLETFDPAASAETVATDDGELVELPASSAGSGAAPVTFQKAPSALFYEEGAAPGPGEDPPVELLELFDELPVAEQVAASLADFTPAPVASPGGSYTRLPADAPVEVVPAPLAPLLAVPLSDEEFATLTAGLETDPVGEWDAKYASAGPLTAEPDLPAL